MGPVLFTPTPTYRHKVATGFVGETVLVENSPTVRGRLAIGGVVAWMSDRDSRKNQDDGESPMKRLSRVLATATAITDPDPDEVEARLRNMSHGTNGD
jgi:hypothetical protein